MRLNRVAVWGSLTVCLIFQSSLVIAQATQPADKPDQLPTWQDVVGRLAGQLAGQDLSALRASLGAASVIRCFNREGAATAERLLASTSQARLLGMHAYARVPVALASDLAEDFKAAGEVVPENVQKDMLPRDPAAEKRANDTAALWINAALQPKKDQPVAVMVFWPTDRRLPTDTSTRRAIFVLVKGQMIGGTYVVQQITFGDPLETPR